MSQPQHCPSCETEYVAGIAACADCGGPLSPGPLEHLARAPDPAAASGAPAAAFDTILATLPGLQAHHAAQALLMEKVPCSLECQGLTKTYIDSPPAEPLAVTLPVVVRVRAADVDSAQEIVASIDADDLIGEQWSDGEDEERPPAGAAAASGEADTALQPEGRSMTSAIVVVVVVAVLLFVFGR